MKIGVNWVLVGNRSINITGAPIGSICCFAVICALDYIFLCRTLNRRPRLSRVLGGPALSCAAMGAAAWAVYGLVSRLLTGPGMPPGRGGMALAMLAGIAAAVLVYAVMIVLTGTLTQEDMALIPRGEAVGKRLHLKKKRP